MENRSSLFPSHGRRNTFSAPFFPARSIAYTPRVERILFTDQTINIDRAFFKQIERRLKTAAARTHNTDLVNDQRRLIEFRLALKG